MFSAGLATAGALLLTACSTDTLLEAVDPDLINPTDLQSPEGATALRLGAMGRLSTITAGGESMWLLGGLLTDEWVSGDTFTQRDETDQRNLTVENGNVTTAYRNIHRARVGAIAAIKSMKQFNPTQTVNIGELYLVKAYAEMTSADNFCNGQPFSDASGDQVEYGVPVSVADAYNMAITSADSGIALIGAATGTQATNAVNALKIVKARAQLALGRDRLGAAATTVAGIPTSFAYNVTFLQVSGDNQIWALNNSARRWSGGDSVITYKTVVYPIPNAVPFVSSKDPRTPFAQVSVTGAVQRTSFDGETPFWAQRIWATGGSPAGRESPVAIANGIDARLIEAEAKLQAGDAAGWLAILNALRTGPTVVTPAITISGMPALVDPGTADARVSLHFREKAFWTYSRGQRLPDMRRLIRQYGRNQAAVFPTGTWFKGGSYGTDVNFPVPQAEQNNPNVGTGKGCTDRNA